MKSIRTVAALAVFLTLSAVEVRAQGATSIRGIITDPQKAVITGATVKLFDKDNGISRTTVTSPIGEYQLLQLRPGTYTLTVQTPGFAIREVQNIQLLVDTPVSLDIALDLATSAATVDVNAEVAQLNAVDASVGHAFEEKKIQSLPLQTRNVVQLLSLQPGVTQSGEVMGARRDQNNIMLDGIDNNDNQNPLSGLNGTGATFNSTTNNGFTSALPVPLDSVQEFRVTVAGDNASAGHSSGGQVALVTRSGSNAIHGSAYEYNRNTDYTANNWFNNRSGVPRPQLVRNQFGASLGGPIKKNRIFYFLNYERRIDSSQQSQSRTVPSESLKQGLIKFKTADGTTYTLQPTDIAAIDPLHIGVTQTMLDYLKQFPVGNAPQLGSDSGLNFSGYLFNAPVKLDYRTYVGRFDWIADSAGKHTVSFRGTLSNDGETSTAAQFAGQQPASQLLQDNRGFGIRYTAVLAANLTNNANIGVTRIGYSQTGATTPSFGLGAISTLQNYTVRGSSRINPTWNFNDELNWIKGRHTVAAGVNLRWLDNNLNTYANSYPAYSMARGVLLGLGQDIYSAALGYVAGANTTAKLANSTAVTNAFGDLLGVVNSYSATYQYLKDGSILNFGQPRGNDFVTHNTEFYVQDAWKVSKKLTVNFGLHYELDSVPYEVNGLQVGTTPGLDNYFGLRAFAQQNGIPGNLLPNQDRLTYALNGPANGAPGWYQPDKNNFAPRISAAYQATSKTVVRAGFGMLYDSYGNDLVSNISKLGSIGLSTTLGTPTSYTFTTSPRYGTGQLPALQPAPAGGFPYTPPNISAISGTYYGIDPSLHAPYSFLLNGSVQQQLRDHYMLEVGYVGRLSRASLIQQDAYAPLIYFKDPKSGINWVQADSSLRTLYNSGVTAAQVSKDPSLVPSNPFVENMFPGLANYYIPGSASANYFYGIYGVNAGSDLDNLHQLDRVTSAKFPNCITVTGCYTFFAPQGSADPSWTNSGFASYHAMIVTVRKSMSSGLGFDFNYTWSHSIDNGSGTASGSGQFGGILQNAFVPSLNRGPSAFDMRHQFNANFVYELPFGRGKTFFDKAPGWLNSAIGGWQASGLVRVTSGIPLSINGSGVFPTNYWFSSVAIPNGAAPKSGMFIDSNGNPSLFQTTTAANSYQDAFPGGTGVRGIVRAPWVKNTDMTVTKSFKLPWESHTVTFRADAFNVFNNVNFDPSTVSASLSSPSTFGEFTKAADARVLQLALRYSF